MYLELGLFFVSSSSLLLLLLLPFGAYGEVKMCVLTHYDLNVNDSFKILCKLSGTTKSKRRKEKKNRTTFVSLTLLFL